MGVLYDMDYIKDVNNKNAAKFYQKGCELNDGDGYYGLGLLYYDGNGVKQDAKKAKELFEKAAIWVMLLAAIALA